MTPITEKSISFDGTVFPDRRSQPRRRAFKGGRLIFNRGYGALECVVRSLSEGGARLSLGDAAGVPARFELLISDDQRMRPATVRWRTVGEVGISFD